LNFTGSQNNGASNEGKPGLSRSHMLPFCASSSLPSFPFYFLFLGETKPLNLFTPKADEGHVGRQRSWLGLLAPPWDRGERVSGKWSFFN
jgi:hypothetical protein